MSTSELILKGYYAHYACQAVICAFIATLLATLSRWQSTGLMRWWSVAWAAHGAYTASAGVSLWLVTLGLTARDPARLALSVCSITAAGMQILALIKGWQSERKGINDFSARRLLRATFGISLIAIAATLYLHMSADSQVRFLFKVSFRGALIASVYMWIGIEVLRTRSLMLTIRMWLGIGLIAFSIKHLLYAYMTAFHKGSISYENEYLLQFIELGLHTVIASPMLLWVCLRFVNKTRSQSEELDRRAQMLEKQDVLIARDQRLSDIGRMAAGVAHDFNNCLAVIQGWTDILRHDSKLNEEEQECVDAIESAATQAGAISQQLMLFGGQRSLKSALVRINDAVTESQRLAPQLSEYDCVVKVPDAIPLVRVDRALLVTSLHNLLINAVDATPPGGTIHIEASQIELSASDATALDLAPGTYVSLEVQDNGIGIPQHLQQEIFEPFVTTKQHGNGLGLPSVQGFARQSGGAATIASSPGRGTRVTIVLPVARESAAKDDLILPTVKLHRPKQQAVASDTPSLLVVDDEAPIALHNERILRRAGFSVAQFTSPIDALAHAKKHMDKVFVLITDIRMPEMSGTELANRMQAVHPNLCVVFVTGYASDFAIDSVKLASSPSVVQKPIAQADLLDAVRLQVSAVAGQHDTL